MKKSSSTKTKDGPSFPKDYLIDTSVLIAGLYERHKTAEVVIKTDGPLYTISLIKIEATNVLKTKHKQLASLHELFATLKDPPFIQLPILSVDLETAFRIATDFNVSVYDALYHAVAMKLFLTFLTLDKDYYEKTKAAGWVELLE